MVENDKIGHVFSEATNLSEDRQQMIQLKNVVAALQMAGIRSFEPVLQTIGDPRETPEHHIEPFSMSELLEFSNLLRYFVFDRSLVKPEGNTWNAIQSVLQQEGWDWQGKESQVSLEELQTYFMSHPDDSYFILSPIMRSLLARQGFKSLVDIDAGGLWNASTFSLRGGDRLVRDTCRAFIYGLNLSFLEHFQQSPNATGVDLSSFLPEAIAIVRAGGDEFSIQARFGDKQEDPITALPVDLHQKISTEVRKQKGLFLVGYPLEGDKVVCTHIKTGLFIVVRNLSVNIAEEEQQMTVPSVQSEQSNSERIQQLILEVPEFAPYLIKLNQAALSGSFSDDELSTVLEIIEQGTIDVYLRNEIAQLRKEGAFEEVKMHRNEFTFLSDLKERGPDWEIVRVAIPGVLKIINAKGGYGKGTQFVQFVFLSIAEAAQELEIPLFLGSRFAGNFTIALPPDDKDKLKVFQDKIVERLGLAYEEYPLMPVVTSAPFSFDVEPEIEFTVPESTGFALGTGNDEIPDRSNVPRMVASELDLEKYGELHEHFELKERESLEGIIKKRFGDFTDLSQEEWTFLAEYFNLTKPRGEVRLAQLSAIQALPIDQRRNLLNLIVRQFYTVAEDPTTRRAEFDVTQLDEFKLVVKALMQVNG